VISASSQAILDSTAPIAFTTAYSDAYLILEGFILSNTSTLFDVSSNQITSPFLPFTEETSSAEGMRSQELPL